MPTATATATATQLDTEDHDHDVLTCLCHAQARRNAIELDLYIRYAFGFPPFHNPHATVCHFCGPLPRDSLAYGIFAGLEDMDPELDEVILRERLQYICYIHLDIRTNFQEPASLDDAIASYLERTGKLQ